MTLRRQELFAVTSVDDDPRSMIAALSEVPVGVHLDRVEHDDPATNAMGHRYGPTRVTFVFRGRARDE